MIRVLIADDHLMVRNGLKQLCEAMEDVVVAGEAANGGEVIDALKHGQFDLVLLDLTMPGVSGRDLVEYIHAQYSRLPILVFSMRNEPKIAQGVLKAGASGYLTKECDQNTMVSAIRKVAAGGRYVEASIVDQVMFDQVEPGKPESREHLSRRELQIMKLLAIGKSITEIGDELELSVKSVSTYKMRVMKKMNFNSYAELVIYAVEYGLINKR